MADKIDVSQWSKGLKRIPPQLVVDMIRGHINRANIIVEVGSGNGHFAAFIETELDTKVIAIDPDSTGCGFIQSSNVRRPDYDSVESYKKAVPEPSPILLALNWPEPNLDYDINAIRALNPHQILLIIESTGSAGSNELLSWVGKFTTGDRFGGYTNHELPPNPYGLVSRITANAGDFVYEALFLETDYSDGPVIKNIDTPQERDPCIIS